MKTVLVIVALSLMTYVGVTYADLAAPWPKSVAILEVSGSEATKIANLKDIQFDGNGTAYANGQIRTRMSCVKKVSDAQFTCKIHVMAK